MMDQQTQLGSAALMVATGVLVAMYLMKDVILATVALPSSAKESTAPSSGARKKRRSGAKKTAGKA